MGWKTTEEEIPARNVIVSENLRNHIEVHR